MATRAQLEQIIIQGGSVSIGGRVISRVQDLPSDAELATGDRDREQAVLADLDAKIADLQQQRDALAARLTPAAPPKKS